MNISAHKLVSLRILTTGFLLAFLGFTSSPANATDYIVICSGQSNMAGVAKIEEMPDELRKMPSNVVYYCPDPKSADPSKLEPLKSFDEGRKKYGPVPRFAVDIAKSHPKDKFIILHNAVGGSALSQWVPDYTPKEVAEKYKWGIGNLWKPLEAQIALIRKLHPEAKMLAFLWLQGETDSFDDTSAIYKDNLARLAANMRKACGSPEMLAIVAEPAKSSDGVFKAVADFTKEDRSSVLVQTKDLSGGGRSNLHFNAKGYDELGKRFAKALAGKMK